MNIVVLIKQVPDTSEIKINFETGTLIREGVKSIMNPDDRAGLEEALKIKDETGAKVTVLSMGPKQAEMIIREAMAMGADDGYLVSDPRFAGADTWATSSTIAAALNEIGFDLIIAGRQAIDGDTAQVGPQVAEKLKIPQVTYVEEILEVNKDSVVVKRQFEDFYQIIEVQLPCVLTTLVEMNWPRFMSTWGIVNAFEREIKTLTLKDISVDPENIGLQGSPTQVKKTFTKDEKAKAELYEGTPRDAAMIIARELKEQNII